MLSSGNFLTVCLESSRSASFQFLPPTSDVKAAFDLLDGRAGDQFVLAEGENLWRFTSDPECGSRVYADAAGRQDPPVSPS